MSQKRPVSTGRVGERTSQDFLIVMQARPVFILLQVRVLAPAEEKTNRKAGLLFFSLRRPEARRAEGPSHFLHRILVIPNEVRNPVISSIALSSP